MGIRSLGRARARELTITALIAFAVVVAAAGCGGGGGGGGGAAKIHDRSWVTSEVAKKSGRDVKDCTNADADNVVPDTVAWACDVKSRVNSGYDAYVILFDADGKIVGGF
jgi:hypothetical protein